MMFKQFAKKGPALVLGAMLLSSCVAYDHAFYSGTYDGYYDGYYGPYIGGYWASDGYFWYATRDHVYHRDDGLHFRHQPFHGGRIVRGQRVGPRGQVPPGGPGGPRGPGRGH